MADKNLHDIKIDELDSPKKTPLKNILTLLALLFIILVISVVITKLILNTDEDTSIDNNDSKSELLASATDDNKTLVDEADNTLAASSATALAAAAIIPVISSNIKERNLTSAIKAPLTSHEPKEMRTYNTPKKNDTAVETRQVPKKTTTVTSTRSSTQAKVVTRPKKEYIDKVVVKRNTTSYKREKASFLGGKRKDITNSFYIKVGTYRNITTVINKVKKNNFNYALVKVESDRTLIRVLVGPFFSRKQANSQLAKVKANILTGAYVTKAK